MNEKEISEKVFKKIEEGKIKPKPKWEFLLKDYIIWGLFLLSLIIGSMAVSVTIFILKNDWVERLDLGIFKSIILSIPYFWVVLLAVFLVVAYYNFKHTNKGYKFNPYLVIVFSVIASIVLGSLVYAVGGGEKLEKIFYGRFPIYRQMMEQRAGMWLDPMHGRIGGIIIRINNDDESFDLKAFDNEDWRVFYYNVNEQEKMFIQEKLRIRIFGKMLENHNFEADNIAPWFGRGKMMPILPMDCMKEINGSCVLDDVRPMHSREY